jgi:pimeloyl-ACP methyl ester carboxylesterase
MATEYLERPGGRLAYDDTKGTGPLVVCLPGIGDVRALYRFLSPALVGAGYRVVTADLRGHGESSVNWPDYTVPALGADILALIDHLDTGPAVVVGESVAAAAAIWAAAQAPDKVSALVLPGPSTRDAKLNPVMRLAAAFVVRVRAAWLAYLTSLYPTRKPADFAAYRKDLSANLREPGRMAALRAVIAAPKAPARDRIPEVTTPVLVVMGTKDGDFPDPTAEGQALARELNGELALIEGAGHYPQAEFPAETLEQVLPFLAKHAEPGKPATNA